MLKLFVVIRWFFALILLIFGTVELFELHQEEFSGNAKTVIEGLRASGYIFPVIGLVEIMVGLSLIMNRFVPFALLFLVRITTSKKRLTPVDQPLFALNMKFGTGLLSYHNVMAN